MKKILVFLCIACSFCSAFAFEWGGIFSNDTKLSSDLGSLSFRQSNKLSLWSNFNFTQDGSTYLIAQGSVKYNWDVSASENSFTPIINVDLLKLASTGNLKNGYITFSAGRFAVSDFTGKIFSQQCDGFSLELGFPRLSMGLYAGFTGLLNANEVYILDESGSVASAASGFYSPCSPYIPLAYTISFPSLFLKQTVSLQATAFIDTTSTAYNRFYANLLVKGPIAGGIYYDFVTSFGSENMTNVMNYSELQLTYYINNLFSVAAGASYATGDVLFFSHFNGFSSYTAYNSSALPELQGLLYPMISVSFVQKKVCVLFDAGVIFDMPEADMTFKGVNANFALIGNIFSDLQVVLRMTGFYDFTEDSETYFTVNLGATLSF